MTAAVETGAVVQRPGPAPGLADRFARVRQQTTTLVAPLSPEDCAIQTMPDVSPSKWHLAHTSWFFETFVLVPHLGNYALFDAHYGYLFNSYYEAVGPRHARPQRGHLSRPSLADVLRYRRHVDEAVQRLLGDTPDPALEALVMLGCQHEQQHQELLLTDIKHVLGSHPFPSAYHAPAVDDAGSRPDKPPLTVVEAPAGWRVLEGGLVSVGVDAAVDFAFDNESPVHRVWLEPYALATRPVTQGDWLDFMADGGYQDARLWLSDGWSWVQQHAITAPLYWQQRDGRWARYALTGLVDIDTPHERDRPVCHISFYEAAAFAQWSGARLPTEAEWEHAARQRKDGPAADAMALPGDFMESGRFDPAPLNAQHPGCAHDFAFGGVWEWTQSSYAPYPGYRPPDGALGEYNAKFMASQMVLRGGSCVTPQDHLRLSYRNFFYPHQRWQFTGLRLARDD
ncbi:MAG: ergothioneine biosynthesis protein EgtB [Oceanococcaceae bacterium]